MSETRPVSRTVDVLDAAGKKTGSAELPADCSTSPPTFP